MYHPKLKLFWKHLYMYLFNYFFPAFSYLLLIFVIMYVKTFAKTKNVTPICYSRYFNYVHVIPEYLKNASWCFSLHENSKAIQGMNFSQLIAEAFFSKANTKIFITTWSWKTVGVVPASWDDSTAGGHGASGWTWVAPSWPQCHSHCRPVYEWRSHGSHPSGQWSTRNSLPRHFLNTKKDPC